MFKYLGRHPVKSLYPSFKPSVVVVDVLDVIKPLGADFTVESNTVLVRSVFVIRQALQRYRCFFTSSPSTIVEYSQTERYFLNHNQEQR